MQRALGYNYSCIDDTTRDTSPSLTKALSYGRCWVVPH